MSEHSEKFQMVKDFYDSGQWKKKAIKNAVKKAWITAAEYEEIVGEPYSAQYIRGCFGIPINIIGGDYLCKENLWKA